MTDDKRKIAVGFSSAVDQKLTCGYLAELGHEPVASLDDPGCDLILLDADTARRVGQQALAQKKSAPFFLPVMVALPADADIGPWLEAGFDDILRLPCTKNELKARITIMLRLRQQSKEIGRKSEYIHRALVESSGDHIFVLDKNGRYVSSNNRVAHFDLTLGEELVGKRLEDVFPAPIAAQYRVQLDRVLATGKTVVFEHHLPSPHSDHYHLDTLYVIDREDGEKMAGGICRDITQRKRTEEKIKRSEARYRSIFENTGTAMVIVGRDGAIVFANAQCLDTTGYAPEQLQGTQWRQYVYPDNLAAMDEYFRLRFTEPDVAPNRYEARLVHADGTTRHCLLSVDSIPMTTQIIVSMLDITVRIRAEESRRLLETAIDHTVECIMISDAENRITYVNRAFERITGYTGAEALGQTPGLLKSGKQKRAFYKRLKSTIYAGHPWQGNMVNRRKDGSFYEVFATIAPICDKEGKTVHFVSVHRDITREREVEKRLQQNQRLEAIGTLAGGIAHDFNNILSPIMGYTEMCLDVLPAGSKVRDDLELVMLASRRAKNLVHQILSFSRQSNHERAPLNIGPIVKEALKLLRASLPTTIEIRQKITSEDEPILADPTEIHQVVMNLCTNAHHAMPEGGVLTVSLQGVDTDQEITDTIPNMRPGRYLKLSVVDTGSGIPDEIREKIFEPYFTTKGEGRGTGLGLAVTHGIVTGCGGAITVHGEPGEGTVFNLYFPTVAVEPAKTVGGVPTVKGGTERILFVDDDTSIAELGKRMLERYGYEVTSCTEPLYALEMVKKDPAAFDLIITDMTMPGMTGDKLAESIMALRPDLPIILCTGFSERINAEKAEGVGIRKFLNKPVPPNELALAVRQLADKPI